MQFLTSSSVTFDDVVSDIVKGLYFNSEGQMVTMVTASTVPVNEGTFLTTQPKNANGQYALAFVLSNTLTEIEVFWMSSFRETMQRGRHIFK